MTSTITESLTNNNAIGGATGGVSLGNGSYWGFDPINNTGNQDFDVGVRIQFRTGASGTSSTGQIGLYAAYSADGGSTWPDGYAGTHGGVSPGANPSSRLIGAIPAVLNNQTYTSNVFSVASGLGYLPGAIGIIMYNNTGATLNGTSGFFSAIYERLDASST